MRVTIVTPVLNNEKFILDCMVSVNSQIYKDLEHLIIDGGSDDGTLSVIERHKTCRTRVLTEPDAGIYDALNKGIFMASGELIGVLGADDMLAADDVISSLVAYVMKNNCDAVYGNLDFISRKDPDKIVRQWRSDAHSRTDLERGWMPPHPSFYVKRKLLGDKAYSLDFGTCGDYDFMLKLLYQNRIKALFLNKLIVCMRNGGMSNGSLSNIVKALFGDYRVLASNGVPNPLMVVLMKKIRKLKQFC